MFESQGKLVYSSDRGLLIKMAREKGLNDYQIIVKLTQGRTYKETCNIAKIWCQHLGISYGKFMKVARGRNW